MLIYWIALSVLLVVCILGLPAFARSSFRQRQPAERTSSRRWAFALYTISAEIIAFILLGISLYFLFQEASLIPQNFIGDHLPIVILGNIIVYLLAMALLSVGLLLDVRGKQRKMEI
jgi:amino acid transporter